MEVEILLDARRSSRPVFSVIVPFHDALPFIRSTIDSLTRQALDPTITAEFLLVDDASTDDGVLLAVDALARCGRALVIRSSGRLGPARARNIGLSMARGQIITFLDADDLWLPDRLSTVYEAHMQKGYEFSCHGEAVRDLEGSSLGWTLATDNVNGSCSARLLRRINYLSTSAVSIDASVMANERFRPLMEPAEDYDLWLRISRRVAPRIIPSVLGISQVHASGMSRRKWCVVRGHLFSVAGDLPNAIRLWGPGILREMLGGFVEMTRWAMSSEC